MREEEHPSLERSNTGFCLRKTDEAIFSTSSKCKGSEMTYIKRSSYGVGIRRDLKADDRINTSAFVSAEKMEIEVLRGEKHSTVPPLGLEKYERIDAQLFLHQAGRDPLQGASPLQWGSLKRSRCSRGPNNQPKACDLAEECKPRGVHAIRGLSVILHSSAVDLEETPNIENGMGRKRKCPIICSSLGKTVASPDRCPAARTDESKASRSKKGFSLPKVVLSLSRKEMEEDFLLFKGSKIPKRPRRRSRVAGEATLYCTPGIWLTDVSYNRYIVKEKKYVEEKPRGLKAMQSRDSDSE